MNRPGSGRLVASVLGVSGSLLLHVLLLMPTFWGAIHRMVPQHEQSNSPAPAAAGDNPLIAFFIEDPDPTMKGASAAPASPHSWPSPRDFLAHVSTPDIPPPPRASFIENEEEDLSPIEISGAPDRDRALLFGRYIGQISARVDRAWQRPRNPLPDRFECRARIVQDKDGTVREIELELCTDDARWRLSLVRAIQSASPLPAPPDPTVFSRTVHMYFASEPFSPGADASSFEPDLATP